MTTTSRLGLPLPTGTDLLAPPAFANFFTNIDAGLGYTFCTSATKPAIPYACQLIYLTDTFQEQIWDPVAGAWVTLINVGKTIYAINQSPTTASGSSATTEVMCGTLTATLDSGTYKIHTEGIISWTSNYSSSTEPTQQGIVRVRSASGASVTTSSALAGSEYVDAWAPKNASALVAQANFSFDSTITIGAPGQFTAGWSYLINALPPGASAFNLQNTLMYFEKVG
jgi:hypothetical protein